MQRIVAAFHCHSLLFIELGDLENIQLAFGVSFLYLSPFRRYNYTSDVEGPYLEIWCQATSDNVGVLFIELGDL